MARKHFRRLIEQLLNAFEGHVVETSGMGDRSRSCL
jgi:hypothetical protein